MKTEFTRDSAHYIQRKFQQALSFHQQGNLSQAQLLYREILIAEPKHFDSLHLLGVIHLQAGHYEIAINLIAQAINVDPHAADAFNNLGIALRKIGRLGQAMVSYNKALTINPDYAEAHYNRGNVLRDLRRLPDALTSFEQAIALNPDYAQAHYNRGNVLRDLHRLPDALVSYEQALAIKPDYIDALNNRGTTLQDLKRLNEALACYEQILVIKPNNVDAHSNRANTLVQLKRLDEALSSFHKVLTINPDYPFALGMYLHTKMKLCDWSGLSENLARYETAIMEGKNVTLPFSALGLIDSPELHLRVCQTYAATKYPRRRVFADTAMPHANGKIRIGYYSADFHNHATAYLVAELFEAHDTNKFELFGFSFGPSIRDEMWERTSSAFDHFIDVTAMSDSEIAQLSRDFGIDIAVDLKGYTTDGRTGIFAEACAPIQVNYLGYPGTLGVDYIDYVIADHAVISKENQDYITEKIVYLPHSYQVNDSQRKIADREFTRQELGLPEQGFVYCCFNNSYKILPKTFDGWMRILAAVDGSVLWLLEDNPAVVSNLRQVAEDRGIDGMRLVFANRLPLDEHLARHRQADLFLDTLPYNAHTTTSDALWAGLPVLTCMGKAFAGRVGGSLLSAVGLPELITNTQEEYETKAIALGLDSIELLAVKRKLAKNRLTTPLFDGKIFARHVEAAYIAMHTRYRDGLPPCHFYIDQNAHVAIASANANG